MIRNKIIWVVVLVMGLFGCGGNKKETTSSGITIESVREDRPKFERKYTKQLDFDRTVVVKITNWSLGDRDYKTGELDQTGGRWVLFDPDKVADRILDPKLVPLVEQAVKEIYKLDTDFWNSKPKEFTDEGGTVWQRVN